MKQQINLVFLTFICVLLFCGSVFAQTIDGLVGWWKFDETSGSTVLDSSGNGYDGTIVDANRVSGRIEGAMDFDGNGDYVNLPVAAFDTICNTGGTDKVTISLWQYGDNISPDDDLHHFMFHGRTGSTVMIGGYMLSNAGKLQWTTYSSDNANKTPASATEYNGQWNHYAFTFDGTADEIKIYQNGVLWSSSTGKTRSLIHAMDAFRLGAQSIDPVGCYYNGMLDDFRVYNRVLSEAEIVNLATGNNVYNFSPAEGAETETAVLLKWDCNAVDPRYNVYLSSDSNQVSGRDEDALVGDSQEEKEYEAGELESQTTYYWTVDVNDGGTIYASGTIMSFITSAASYAVEPLPANGEEYVETTRLSWTPANAMISQDVYFGTDSELVENRDPSVLIAETITDSNCPIGKLQNGVTYYWLVDTTSASGMSSLGLWSFTAGHYVPPLSQGADIEGLMTMIENWLVDNSQVVDQQLLGRWNFDNGNANDSSGNGYNGTVSASGATIVTDPVRGKVLDLNGTSGYVDIPVAAFDTITNATTGTDKITISLWQYGDNIVGGTGDGLHHFLFHGRSGSSAILIGGYMLTNAGKIQWTSYTSENINKTPTSATEYNGQWNHYAYTFDGAADEMKIYQNGQLWLSGAGKDKSLKHTMDAFRLGASTILDGSAVQQFYSGMLDDFRVYGRVLSAADIINLSNGSEPSEVTCTEQPEADLNGDCKVDFFDYAMFANEWLKGQIIEDDLPPMPDDVKCNNTQLMLGNRKGVASCINWQNTGGDYTQSQVSSGAQTLSNSYKTWSRGRVQMVGLDGTGTRYTALSEAQSLVPYNKSSGNMSEAQKYINSQNGISSSALKWFVNSGCSTANAGGTTCDTKSTQAFTVSHEMGHLFRLGHGVLLTYNSDGTFKGTVSYGDRTTNMGNVSAGGFNLPELHRLKWIDEDEVAVFKKEDSGSVYRIRKIHRYVDENLAGVCYYLPYTGNLMWISVTERGSTYAEKYLGKNLALTKYITDRTNTSGMQETYCITHMVGEHTDDFGLTYENVGVDPSGNWVDIKITYDPANVRCLPLIITQTQRVLTPVSSGTKGKIEVTVEITNPSPANTVPVFQLRYGLSVPNSNGVAKLTDLGRWLTGGTTGKTVYTVESKTGPLSEANAHLTGSFQYSYRYPFTFSINFE